MYNIRVPLLICGIKLLARINKGTQIIIALLIDVLLRHLHYQIIY